MKVVFYEGAGSIKLQERPDPKAGPGEVVVRVKYCGICGTDVHAYLREGVWATNIVLGHETVGTITEIGEGVEGLKVGDRVAVNERGHGGMAEYVKIHDPKTLFKIPDEVSFEDAVLWDPIGVALKGIRLSYFKIGDNVVVAGAGAIGLAAIQLLKMGGARRIIALEPSEKKWDLARKLGADLCLNPLKEGTALRDKVVDFFGGNGADVVFECAGQPKALEAAFGLVKRGGQVMLTGVTDDEAMVQESRLVLLEVAFKASLTFTDEDIKKVLELLAQGRINTEGMVTETTSIDDVVKGIERLASGEEGIVKILIAP